MFSKLRTVKPKLQGYINQGLIKKLAVVCGGLLLFFIVLNVVVYAVFLQRTYPNTHISNFSIGTLNYGALSKEINSLPLLPATISLQQQGKNSSVTPAQLGIQIDNAKIETAAKNRSWLPLQNFFISHNSSVALKIDQATLMHKLAGLAANDKQAPADAQIVLQGGQFVLAKSTNGYQLNVTQSAAAVIKAVYKDKAAVTLPFTATVPTISNASLHSTLQQLQTQQAVALSYTYNGTVTKPTAATIASWYSLVNNGYAPQASKIQTYITQVGANDNIQVQNINAAITATQSALQKMTAMTFTLVAVPPTVCSSNTLSQFILVSITQQHMWACQGPDQVYDSPVTTGAYQVAGDATPTGTWHIYAKERDVHLIGPTWDDFVNYWLPFYSDYGFHDATWQTFPFGGSQYPTQGSHGCVHLPLNAVTWLYSWSRIGTTVTITQ
jgi:lipoprotein-anchoring transpeptidase ErfK/SrfK